VALARAVASAYCSGEQTYFRNGKATWEIFSKSLMLGSIASQIDPAAQGGKLSRDFASQLIQSASVIQNLIPNKDDLLASFSAVLDANKVAKKTEIWQERDASLDSSKSLQP